MISSANTQLPSAPAEETAFASLTTLPPQTITARLAFTLPSGRIAALMGTIEHALAGRTHPVIHVLSAYDGEGSQELGFETAWAAAQSGKRVLLLDATLLPTGSLQTLRREARFSVTDYLHAAQPSASPLLNLSGTSFYYAAMSGSHTSTGSASPANTSQLKALLVQLQQAYDLIVVVSESALANGSAATYAAITDGVVIVIEAERTRAPVVKELAHTIESSSGRILGTVLNKRRFYIPGFLYSLLFRG